MLHSRMTLIAHPLPITRFAQLIGKYRMELVGEETNLTFLALNTKRKMCG